MINFILSSVEQVKVYNLGPATQKYSTQQPRFTPGYKTD